MSFFRVSLSLLALAAGPALADCPTQDDLSHGIFVHYDDGSYARITRMSDGRLFEDVIYTDGSDRFGNIYEGGVLQSRTFGFKDGSIRAISIAELTYSGGNTDIASVEAGKDRLFEYKKVDRSGTSEGTTLVEKDEETTVNIGDCSATAFPVTTTETRGGERFTVRYFWLPEPGIPIFRMFQNSEDGSSYSLQATKLETDFPIAR